jgi:hypothetical protein
MEGSVAAVATAVECGLRSQADTKQRIKESKLKKYQFHRITISDQTQPMNSRLFENHLDVSKQLENSKHETMNFLM